MATANKPEAPPSYVDEPIIYHNLMDWLKEQQAQQKPLSDIQKKAIAVLIAPPPTEPEVGESNWVGLVNSFAQTRDATINYKADTQNDSFSPNPRHVCICELKLPGADEVLTFPNPSCQPPPTEAQQEQQNRNIIQGWTMPTFARRKDAKQYAAKCCVEHLIRIGEIELPENGGAPKFPVAKKLRAEAAAAKSTTTTTTTTNGGGNNTKNNNNNNNKNGNNNNKNGNNNGKNDNGLPLTKRIEQLCSALGLSIPQYRATPSADQDFGSFKIPPGEAINQQFFDARAEWLPRDVVKVPRGLGRVTKIYGRKNAVNAVAEQVYEWLVKENARRVKEMETVLGVVEEEKDVAEPTGGAGLFVA